MDKEGYLVIIKVSIHQENILSLQYLIHSFKIQKGKLTVQEK